MWITLFQGVSGTPNRATVTDIEPSKFLDFIGTKTKWKSVECATEKDKLAGFGYACARYKEGAQSKANANLDPESATELFVYDIDNMTAAAVAKAESSWHDYDCAIYSTFKHSQDAPRLRLLVRLSEPVPNAKPEPYKSLYLAGATQLNIKYDPVTLKVANFFLGPQHKPGTNGSAVRQRFNGRPLDVAALAAVSPESVTEPDIVRPNRDQLKNLADRLVKRDSAVGTSLRAALKGEALCEIGNVHDTMVRVSFECVRHWRGLDAEWFATTHLSAACAAVPPGADKWEHRLTDWIKCVDTAKSKWARYDAARARILPEEAVTLTEAQIKSVESMKGALLVSFSSAYYVFSPYVEAYTGPFRAAQVSTAFREGLGAMPGVSELTQRGNGPPALKSAMQLNHQYGCTVGAVHYYAESPPEAYSAKENAIKVQAYKWMDWKPKHSACADELLRMISGDKYSQLESYLFKFRDLSQPLPALTLVGPNGAWKSQIAQTLSRFWGNRDHPTPCRADKVLLRFSSPLLHNPVVWSDEKLATERGEKGIPERYRESISERTHAVELKGIDPFVLFSATRHVISVNEIEKVFSAEVDAASVEATLIRFLVLNIEREDVDAFEARWEGTEALERLREGSELLEHVRWLEENTEHVSEGRFWVNTSNDPDMIWRARFADETLNYCLTICVDQLINESKHSVPGQLSRLPMICDETGGLRMSPDRINQCWADADIVAGSSVRKPAPTTIGRYLVKAGIKKYKNERASKSIHKSWAVCHETLQRFLKTSERCTWTELESAVLKVFKVRLNDPGAV